MVQLEKEVEAKIIIMLVLFLYVLHISVPITVVLQVSGGMKKQVILMASQDKNNSLTTTLKIKQLCNFNDAFLFKEGINSCVAACKYFCCAQ